MMHYLIAALATRMSALTCACFVAYAAYVPVWLWCHPRELRERTEEELHDLIHRDALYSGLRFTLSLCLAVWLAPLTLYRLAQAVRRWRSHRRVMRFMRSLGEMERFTDADGNTIVTVDCRQLAEEQQRALAHALIARGGTVVERPKQAEQEEA